MPLLQRRQQLLAALPGDVVAVLFGQGLHSGLETVDGRAEGVVREIGSSVRTDQNAVLAEQGRTFQADGLVAGKGRGGYVLVESGGGQAAVKEEEK